VAAGLDVVVLDRSSFPRDKPCAGWITPAVIDELELDVQEYRAGERVFQPIFGFRTSWMGSGEVLSRYDRPISYGIRRCEFDTYLLRRSGARLRLGEPLATLRRSGARWIVNEAIESPLLIGAGGHFCPVARRIGRQADSDERPVVAQEVEFLAEPDARSACPVDPEVPELFFCRDLLGYGWCFRKGNHFNIGLGRLDSRGLADHVAAFGNYLASHRGIPTTQVRSRGHAYLVRRDSRRELVGDRVLLIGDAAGLAHAESGEGIRPAVESALLAARTITAARGRNGADDLEPYRHALISRFGPTGPVHDPLAFLPKGLKARVGGLLLGLPWFARRVVMEDWFLRIHQPVLRWDRNRDGKLVPENS
jgi:flavin-dependent dehydrogenase